jgi:hypothetical protein
VKKEKIREKGLPDSRNPIAKKEKVCEKGFAIARIPSMKKRPETTTSCGLEKSHPSRDSHQKGPRQQQVVA